MTSTISYPYRLPEADSPLEIINRMIEIARRDRITHGAWCETSSDWGSEGQLCSGHRFCAVGTLFYAAGSSIDISRYGPYMPAFQGNDPHDGGMLRPYGLFRIGGLDLTERMRDEDADRLPHLKTVRGLCNQVAVEWMESGRFERDSSMATPDPLEDLFENWVRDDGDQLTSGDLVLLFTEVRDRIREQVTA